MTYESEQMIELSKGACAARLTGPARDLHRALLAGFAGNGLPPARAVLHEVVAGVDLAAAVDELVAADLIVVDEGGEPVVAYPFSATPTRHRLDLGDGVRAYAMCAVDALGVSAMLGTPVTVTSGEPGTGHPISVRVDRDQAVWHPAGAVMYAGQSRDRCATAALRTCGYINLFTTVKAADAWAAAHPHLTGTVLDQQHALAEAVAEFGAFLHDPPVPESAAGEPTR